MGFQNECHSVMYPSAEAMGWSARWYSISAPLLIQGHWLASVRIDVEVSSSRAGTTYKVTFMITSMVNLVVNSSRSMIPS